MFNIRRPPQQTTTPKSDEENVEQFFEAVESGKWQNGVNIKSNRQNTNLINNLNREY